MPVILKKHPEASGGIRRVSRY